jgi:hypothetical protein
MYTGKETSSVKSAIILTPNSDAALASSVSSHATSAPSAEAAGGASRLAAVALKAGMPPGAVLVQDGAASTSGVTVFEINHTVTPAPAGAVPTPTLMLADLEPQARRSLLQSGDLILGAARGLLQESATTSECCKIPKRAVSCEGALLIIIRGN